MPPGGASGPPRGWRCGGRTAVLGELTRRRGLSRSRVGPARTAPRYCSAHARLQRRPPAGPCAGRRRRRRDHGPLQGPRPEGRDETGPDAGHRGGQGGRGADPRPVGPCQAAGRGARRGVRQPGQRAPALDRRPHRRHQELRQGRARVGDPDRAGGTRRAGRRGRGGRGVRPGAGPPLVGGAGQRRLHRAQPVVRDPAARVAGEPAGGRVLRLLLAERLGGAGAPRRLPAPVAQLLAHPRIRRLLAVHDGGRGIGRHLRRARAEPVGHGGQRRHRPGGGRPLHLPRRRARSLRRQCRGLQRAAARGPPGLPRRFLTSDYSLCMHPCPPQGRV
ncbi:putative Butyryl-CoA dehydrogenase [Actinacidiphila bryophytorum]|uniref:Butyryl-CoA dehydrogenase n=1 Tax=Actinacidiphila bryophytorum TaxID=1436133 RepID=A0A9W4E6D4_9ACTN|nr:putative Butyryl-CoA dehydrogenase [Actinacidiphila bryophytorum]